MTHHELSFKAFVKLGNFLRSFVKNLQENSSSDSDNKWFQTFTGALNNVIHYNGWFTKENCLHAFTQWGQALTEENLKKWLSTYELSMNKEKTVALILAGNIPLVGFHDLLTVLITGNKALVKLSSNDEKLIPLLVSYLVTQEPALKPYIEFSTGRLTHFDAVIATGSDNTARYFEYYFGQKPHIIRKNRNSVAVLTGNETKGQLTALGEDIFRYYGLGCRSVSKLFVPKGYKFDTFFQAMFGFQDLINHHKYANNYDYNKAVYLMSEFTHLDNGFLILKEESSYASPIATIFYEEYDNMETLKEKLRHEKEHIQCIVSDGLFSREVPFGKTQSPALNDYADDIDTVEFLLRTSPN